MTTTIDGTAGVTFPAGGVGNPAGAVVGLTDTQTLTNKTLTAPVIATITNTGTLTLPTSTDTLVGRATTDTLTNKTLTAPALGTPTSGILTSCTGLNYDGFKNRIINGAMVIDQRNAGASVSATSGGQYFLDRFACGISAGNKFTVQQSSTAPTGFTKSSLITSSTAWAVGSTDYATYYQYIEGYNIADLGFGAAGASTVTLSFWVRSSLTGTFGGTLSNSASRFYPFTYTISTANTWEQKTVTIAGDITGTWQTTTSTGISVLFSLAAGSSLVGTANAWTGAATYQGATGQTNILATNGATWYVTGVQLEKGSTATSFDYRSIGTELALCQRYYSKTFPQLTAPAQNAGATGAIQSDYAYAAASGCVGIWDFSVVLRANPTITTYNPSAANSNWSGGMVATLQAAANPRFIAFLAAVTTVGGNNYLVHATADAEL